MANDVHGTLNAGDGLLIQWDRGFFQAADEGIQAYLLTADGLQPITHSMEYEDFLVRWSGDGNRLWIEGGYGDVLHPAFQPPPDLTIEYFPPVFSTTEENSASLSPDDIHIAYPARDASRRQIVRLYNLQTGTDRALPTRIAFHSQWLHDGQRINVIDTGSETPMICTYQVDGSLLAQQAAAWLLQTGDWTLSPDGTRIAFSRENAAGTLELLNANLDGSDPVVLGTMNVWDSPPVWSPDGRQLAWVSEDEGMLNIKGVLIPTGDEANRHLCVAQADGTNIRHLMALDKADGGEIVPGTPAWSADGTQLAIGSFIWNERVARQSPGAAGSAVFVLAADGSDLRQVTDAAGLIFGIQWRPV